MSDFGQPDTFGLFEYDEGLKIAGSPWYLDSRKPRARCLVSHGHSDHLPWGDRNVPPDPKKVHGTAVCHPITAQIGRLRGGLAQGIMEIGYHEPTKVSDDLEVTLSPAGHVLGSAMIHVRRGEHSLLYTGDYKLRRSRTVPIAEPLEADVLVMESTYGKPFFRFPPTAELEERLVELCTTAMKRGKQPMVFGYALGKAQEIIKILVDAGLPVTMHGAVANLTDIYLEHGVDFGTGLLRRYKASDFKGNGALDLEERGVLVAPPREARGNFAGQFGEHCTKIMMSGWALLSGAQFRYGVDYCLPLSDHGDFDELVQTIERVRPKVVLSHHGGADFPDILMKMGLDQKLGFRIALAKPPAQMTLF